MLSSPSSPGRDADGNIQVEPGDSLPGIPKHRIKAERTTRSRRNGLSGPRWSMSVPNLIRETSRIRAFRFPATLSWACTRPINPKNAELFLTIRNVVDKRYSNFGIYGDPAGIGAPGIPADAGTNDPRVDNRFQSPGVPRSVFGASGSQFGLPNRYSLGLMRGHGGLDPGPRIGLTVGFAQEYCFHPRDRRSGGQAQAHALDDP